MLKLLSYTARHLSLALILLACLSLSQAQGQASSQLEKQLQRYQQAKHLTFQFKQRKHLVELGVSLQSEGELEIGPDERIRWAIRKPAPLEVLMLAKKISIKTQSDQGITQIQQISLEQFLEKQQFKELDELTQLTRLRSSFIQKNYHVKSSASGRYQLSTKTPKLMHFQQVDLDIAKNAKIQRIKLYEPSGDQLELFFTHENLQ